MAASTLSVQYHPLGNSPKLGLRGSVEARRVKLKGSGRPRRDQMDDTSLTPSSEDPLRILAPGKKKLSTIESQRVLAVMEEAIKRMSNAMLIPTFANSLDRYSVSLGVELVGMLKEYRQLTAEYNRLYSECEQQGSTPYLDHSNEPTDASTLSTLRLEGAEQGASSVSSIASSGHPTRLEPLGLEKEPQTTEARFQQVRFMLKHSVKCILRAMHKNPSASSLLSAASSAPGTPRNALLLQEEMR